MKNWKRYVLLIGIMLTMAAFLSGCGTPAKLTEKNAKEILPSELWTLVEETNQVTIPDNEIALDVESIEVENSKTDGKSNVTYVNAVFSNDAYRITESLTLYYSKYDDGKWLIDNYDLENYEIEVLDPEYIETVSEFAKENSEDSFPEATLTDVYADNENKCAVFSYAFDNSKKINCTTSGTYELHYNYSIGTDSDVLLSINWKAVPDSKQYVDEIKWHYDGKYHSVAENEFFDVDMQISRSSDGAPYLDAVVQHEDTWNSKYNCCYEYHGIVENYCEYNNSDGVSLEDAASATFEFTPLDTDGESYRTYHVRVYGDRIEVGEEGWGYRGTEMIEAQKVNS